MAKTYPVPRGHPMWILSGRRPGHQALVAATRSRQFDMVLGEDAPPLILRLVADSITPDQPNICCDRETKTQASMLPNSARRRYGSIRTRRMSIARRLPISRVSLNYPWTKAEASDALCALIDRDLLTPDPDAPDWLRAELHGDMAEILWLGAAVDARTDDCEHGRRVRLRRGNASCGVNLSARHNS